MPAREVRLKSNRSLKLRNSKRLTSKQWPDMYGFTVTSGPIPCYVISVERGCPAHRAGICPGDQIVEIDGRNVADMSADNVRSLASASQSSPEADENEQQLPPKIGVVSRVQYLELTATDPKIGYGLTWSGIRPTVVDGVHPNGPAHKAGVLPGDIILEVDGRVIRTERTLMSSLAVKPDRFSRITLAMIAVDSTKPAIQSSTDQRLQLTNSKGSANQTTDLFAKMNEVLQGDFEKKMAVVGLMKKYAENRDIVTFSKALSVLLVHPKHRTLIDDIRSFIPQKQRAQFESAIKVFSKADGEVFTSGTKRPTVKNSRLVSITRAQDGSFGFVLRGNDPVWIESVITGSPAQQAGLAPGDSILDVNEVDVRKLSHDRLIKILQLSGKKPTLRVASKHGLSRTSSEDSLHSLTSISSSEIDAEHKQMKPHEDVLHDGTGVEDNAIAKTCYTMEQESKTMPSRRPVTRWNRS